MKATDIPVVAFSAGEEELAGLDTAPLAGQLAARNHLRSVDKPENAEFIGKWKEFIKADDRVTNDPMEAHLSASPYGSRRWRRSAPPTRTP